MPARTIIFRVRGGVVVDGADPILSLLLDRDGVFDLRLTSQLDDGWYQFDAVSGITRLIAHPPTPQHQHKSLRPRGWNTAKRRRAITA
jgi:hypothetical protein